MQHHTPFANGLLLIAALIWGFGFVAQRLGMDYMGPYTFNGARFLLGALSLVPLLWWWRAQALVYSPTLLRGGLLAGALLFLAASLQQVGLQYTTVTNAGFITGLYLILVPLLGLFLRQKTHFNTWLGAVITLVGLYVLSIQGSLRINYGDALQLIGAFFWALHLLVIDHYARRTSPIALATIQFMVCGLLSFAVAGVVETPTWAGVSAGWQAVLYAGLVSVGIAYTLQVIGQRHANPTHAAIILSLEALFAALGGIWLLDEALNNRILWGGGLMLVGLMVSQIPNRVVIKTQ